MSYTAMTQVAPGQGLLCRRDTVLFFAPEPGDRAEALVEVFSSPDPFEAAVEMVADGAAETPPFALIDFSNTVELMVFGDVRIESDHRTMEALTGAGSSTCVEFRFRGMPDALSIRSAGAVCASGSDLSMGRVPAAGFSLDLVAADGPAATASPIEPLSEPVTPVIVDSPAVAASAPGPESETTVAETIGSRIATPEDREMSTPESAAPATVDSPLGHLRLPSGELLPLTKSYVFGRNPKVPASDEVEGVVIKGEKLSRTHASISVTLGGVVVLDLGSTNKTRLLRSGSDSPVALEPGQPTPMSAGDSIFLGAEQISFEATPINVGQRDRMVQPPSSRANGGQLEGETTVPRSVWSDR